MAIKPIKNKSISSEVIEQIKEQIILGEWAPGAKIPGEHELTQMFGVSRISVREAIHRLAGMGVLSVRRGEGTYVNEAVPREYFNSLLPILMIEGADLLEILEFRAMMEIHGARLAAARAEAKDIALMEGILERMERSKEDIEKFAMEDLNFHHAVAIATGNKVIIKVNAIIHDMLKSAMLQIVDISGTQGGLYFHKRILDAIRSRDEKTAAEEMQLHIEQTIQRVKNTMKSQ